MKVWLAAIACACTAGSAQARAHGSLASMPYESIRFEVPDPAPGAAERLRIGKLTLVVAYELGSESKADVSFERASRAIYKTKINNLFNANGWVAVSPDRQSFAFTWSDGGAIGGFHTRIFVLAGEKVIEKSEGINEIQRFFSAHHNCATRPNNYSAVRWLSNGNLLIESSVYDTGDCSQLGYTERFVLDVQHAKIVQREQVPDRP